MADFVVIGFSAEYVGDRVVEWVELAPAGEAFERTRTMHRIKDIRTPENVTGDKREGDSFKVMEARWAAIAPKYEAWKRNEDIPDDGTPLAAWAGVSTAQAAHLKAMGIRTVEAVATMGEGAIARLPFPNAKKLPELAKNFLSSKGEAAKDAELADMRERMAIMEEMIAAGQSEKRGPGRPRKEPEAA